MFSEKLDEAVGQQLRCCSDECLQFVAALQLCTHCSKQLPPQALADSDLEAAVGHVALFCSPECVQQARRERLCVECSRPVAGSMSHCQLEV